MKEHIFKPRLGMYGTPEVHTCHDCGEGMQVCDDCSGDYHDDVEVRKKCPSKRLNNSI